MTALRTRARQWAGRLRARPGPPLARSVAALVLCVAIAAGGLAGSGRGDVQLRNEVRSQVGAMGVMQLMPATVRHVRGSLLRSRPDPATIDGNVHIGTRYLRFLIDANRGDVRRAPACYHQGMASVRARGMYRDTRRYVRSVVALRSRFARG